MIFFCSLCKTEFKTKLIWKESWLEGYCPNCKLMHIIRKDMHDNIKEVNLMLAEDHIMKELLLEARDKIEELTDMALNGSSLTKESVEFEANQVVRKLTLKIREFNEQE